MTAITKPKYRTHLQPRAVMTLDVRGRLVLDNEMLKKAGVFGRQFAAAEQLGAALSIKSKQQK